MSEPGLITVRRGAVQAWANDSLAIASGLRHLRADFAEAERLAGIGARDAGAMLASIADRLASYDGLAIALVRDFAGHGVIADTRSASVQEVELHPGAPASALAFLDEVDPLPGGAVRTNGADLAALAAGEEDDGVDEDGGGRPATAAELAEYRPAVSGGKADSDRGAAAGCRLAPGDGATVADWLAPHPGDA